MEELTEKDMIKSIQRQIYWTMTMFYDDKITKSIREDIKDQLEGIIRSAGIDRRLTIKLVGKDLRFSIYIDKELISYFIALEARNIYKIAPVLFKINKIIRRDGDGK